MTMRVSACLLNSPWKQAATIILCSFKPLLSLNVPPTSRRVIQSTPKLSRNFDYEVLLLERGGSSKFMPNAYVFPGGRLNDADHCAEWAPLFKAAGFDVDNIVQFTGIKRDNSDKSDSLFNSTGEALTRDLSLRICSIRETFEECGVLLCTPINAMKSQHSTLGRFSPGSAIDSKLLQKWQSIVQKDANKFLVFCEENGLLPNVWELYEWGNWLTPTHLPAMHGGKRFDTIFYISFAQETPETKHDDGEIIKNQWYTPFEVIQDYRAEKFWLPPPQYFELSRMCGYQRLDELRQFAARRQTLGSEKIMPVYVDCTDGSIALFPGDDLYPNSPDYLGVCEKLKMNKSLDEVRRSSSRLNRMENRTLYDCEILSTVTHNCGHLTPTWRSDMDSS